MVAYDDGRDDNGKDQNRSSDGTFGHKKVEPPTSPFKPEIKNTSSVHDPLFSFTLNNPFKKLLQWIDYLRKHHTTTFDFKIKVPLIALPIFLFVVIGLVQGLFNLGQYVQKQETAALPSPTPIIIVEPTTTPAPVIGSYLGFIQSTYQIPSITLSPPVESSPSAKPASQIFTRNRYILLDKEDTVTFLEIDSKIDMNPYLGKRVLITGLYDQSRKLLQLTTSGDIEIVQ